MLDPSYYRGIGGSQYCIAGARRRASFAPNNNNLAVRNGLARALSNVGENSFRALPSGQKLGGGADPAEFY
jgi:hypothetical protein